ncbi:MAG: DNA mismatch repair protein MutL [Paraglaciecola sp.]
MPIQILPARLANQIAAGEVVERPASVVKELVENCLDAGATSIEIEIEQGGHKRITIRDNGGGIHKDELALALSRHATSKIASLDDLEHISSLGFRGEALASISSVARLTLSSKPAEQKQAWQAHSEGRDMAVQLNPVAHPNGTSVDVVDLFFNTPARRKFLRTEKTEFNHIDEVIRRIALSRFDVSFSLKHNGKILRKYGAQKSAQAQLKRVSAICDATFAQQAIELNSQYQQLKLHGWLAPPEAAKEQADFQYFYVNGRVMRDKLIGHAIRQAFEGVVSANHQPAYVLYLHIEPEQVDVNVHPAKHEVRFHQARLVHDFIFRALRDGINQYFVQRDEEPSPEGGGPVFVAEAKELPRVEPAHGYIQPLTSADPAAVGERSGAYTPSRGTHSYHGPSPISPRAAQNYQHLMTTPVASGSHSGTLAAKAQWLKLNEQQVLVAVTGGDGQGDGEKPTFFVLDIATLHIAQLQALFSQHMPVSQPLMMPVSINASPELLTRAKALYQPLLDNSVEIGWSPKRIILRKVPAGLRQLPWVNILQDILSCEEEQPEPVRQHLLRCIGQQALEFSHEQTQELWDNFCQSHAQGLIAQLKKVATALPLTELLATHVKG